jgi:hypothetical protein
MGAEAITYRVRVGRLIPVYAGVYAVGHVPGSPVDRAVGALLACGPGAALSHGSAASLWGIFKQWSMPFEVTARSDHRRQGIRVHRSRTLTRKDIRVHLGVRVTSPARTLLDIAPRLSDPTLTRAVNDLRLASFLRLTALAELLDRCGRHPGAPRLASFIQAPTSGPTRSKFEDAFVAFTQRYGLPTPIINARFGGRIVDALLVAERVIVELDGYDVHSSRSSFENDRDRDADHLVAGFPTVRITWPRLRDTPEKEANRLEAILRHRREDAA